MIDWKNYILPQLLALVPFLIGLTEVVKTWLFSEDALAKKAEGQEGKARKIAYKILPEKGRIPIFVWLLAILFSTSYGFIVSTYQGWRMVVNSLVMVGLVQGSIVGFASMGIFDAILKRGPNVLEKTKTIIHAILAFLLGILGFCIGRRFTRSKTNDNKPNTERVESALSETAGKLSQASSELRESSNTATSITDGIAQSQEQAHNIGEHLNTASELIGNVITDTRADADTATRISELIDELENRVGESNEETKN